MSDSSLKTNQISSLKSKLRLTTSSFNTSYWYLMNSQYLGEADLAKYRSFLNNPQSKNFTDFQEFIQFISSQDFDKLQDKKRREKDNKDSRVKIHPALSQAFYIKQTAMNELESHSSQENFESEITNNSFTALEKRGKCLSGLYVDKIHQGPNGRCLLYMIDRKNDISEIEEKYKECPFEIDDQIAFCYTEHSPVFDAVGKVYQRLNNGIVISLDVAKIPPEFYLRLRSGKPFSLVKQDYQASFEVNRRTLEKLSKICDESNQPMPGIRPFVPGIHPFVPHDESLQFMPHDQPLQASTPLLEDLLRENLDDKENEVDEVDAQDIVLLDQGLNEDQKRAVKAALAAKSVYLIDGPAGTGKTRVLAEVIHQSVKKGLKVLACGPSVYAVDNLIGRMLDKNVKACRIGKSGNPNEDIDRFSMDTLLKKNKKIKANQDECGSFLEFFKLTEHKVFLEKMGVIAKESSIYQKGVSQVIIDYADVVFCTLRGAAASVLEQNNFNFDVAIIDECSQATEIAAWAPILQTKKLIIAGDRLQLPPFIINQEAKKLGLNFTLFDRLRKRLPRNLRKMLRVQYRMNEKIMAWSNEHFYRGKLIASDVCAQYTLQEYLKRYSQIPEDKVPILMLVDTKGVAGFEEKRGTSYSNVGEAAVVLELLEHLLENYDLKKEDIGVISPYQDQHELVTKAIECKSDLRGVKCQTVDYFQGKEKEVIIISLVRSNKDKIVGFLDDSRRMNVAVTRAKRFVAIVCDTSTICKPELPFMVKLINHFKNEGQVLKPDDFKGFGYHMRSLQSVLNGEISPPEKRKSEVKVIKNMDAINQILAQNPVGLKDNEEEEKIQLEKLDDEILKNDFMGMNEYKARNSPINHKLKKNTNNHTFIPSGPYDAFVQNVNDNFMPINPALNQNMNIPRVSHIVSKNPIFHAPVPRQNFGPAQLVNHDLQNNNQNGMGMNYSHSQPEREIKKKSEDKSIVGNPAIFVKNKPKKKKNNKNEGEGGIQIKPEDFPELGS